ncbi:hypothetical protein ABIF68_006149 [Bradyrhizobium japonicum]|uniref:hypothetical protein n=1 Tax=Bradyrhizobium TaxID=374 RepID=UPI0004B47256|nr:MULTISPECIES: hypothetical protein [Bradyrhizobium]MDI2072446.1 hypothetical protein [Bradyrhizobium sp. Mp27]
MIRQFFVSLNDKLGLGDLLWQIAASDVVILTLAALVFVCMIVGHFPIISKLPAVAPYASVAAVLVYVFLSAQAFLVGYRFADGRAEAKALREAVAVRDDLLARQRSSLNLALDAAETAVKQRDEAAQRAQDAQDEIDDYEERLKARPNAACLLTPDDFTGGVQDHGKR